MLATKRKIETEQDRFGGFSNRMPANRDIFASSIVEAPNYDTDIVSNIGGERIGEQVFEVEKEYKINSPIVIDEGIQPIKSFMPTVQKKTKAIADSQTNAKIRVNTRGKIMIAVYSCVVLLLSVFAIYNAFAINRISKNVSQSESIYASEQASVNILEGQLNNMTTESNIRAKLNGNFREVRDSDKVYLRATDKTEIPTYKEPTNLFDKLCGFLSEMFN